MKKFLFAITVLLSAMSCTKPAYENPVGDIAVERLTYDESGVVNVYYENAMNAWGTLACYDAIGTPEEFNQLCACMHAIGYDFTAQQIHDMIPAADGRLKANTAARSDKKITRLLKGSFKKNWSDYERTLFLVEHWGLPLLPMVSGESNHPLDFVSIGTSRDKATTADIYNSAAFHTNPLISAVTNFNADSCNFADKTTFDTAYTTEYMDTLLVDGQVVALPGDFVVIHFSMSDEGADDDEIYGPDINAFSELVSARYEIVGTVVTNIWQ